MSNENLPTYKSKNELYRARKRKLDAIFEVTSKSTEVKNDEN